MPGAASGAATRGRAVCSAAAIDAVAAAADAATAAAAAAVAAAAVMASDAQPLSANVLDRGLSSVSGVALFRGGGAAADAVSTGEVFIESQAESSAPLGSTVVEEAVVGRLGVMFE